MKSTNLKNYDRLVVVVNTMRVWTGTRILKDEDFRALGYAETSEEQGRVLKPGLKQIFDPDKLKVFEMLRVRARRLLEEAGIPFAKGFALPLDRADEILGKLDEIQKEFRERVDVLIEHYDRDLEAWIHKNPGFEALLRQGCVPKAELGSRFEAGYLTMRIQPLRPEDEEKTEREVSSLSVKRLDEVSKDTTPLLVSMLGKTECEGKCLRQLETIRNKLNGLSFLSAGILLVVDMLDRTLDQCPRGTVFGGFEFEMLKTCTSVLANRQLLEDLSNGKLSFEDEHEARMAALGDRAPKPDVNLFTMAGGLDSIPAANTAAVGESARSWF